MPTISIGDTELYYEEKGAGEPVLFIHGSLNDYRIWQAQMEALSDAYHVITYSRRYHYPNPLPSSPVPYAVTDQARDLAAFIGGLGVAPVHVVCASYGGCVALTAAVEHPELFRSLVLGEPPLLLWLLNTPEGDELVQAHARRMNDAHQAFERGEPEKGVGIFMDAVLGAGTFERFSPGAQARLMENAAVLRLEAATAPEVFFPQLTRSQVRKIARPALLLTGESSPRLFHLVADQLDQTLPDCERVMIPNASHAIHNMNPTAYNARVQSFLDRTRS